MPNAIVDAAGAEALQAEDVALFLDVDGALLDMAPRPGAVFVPPSLIESLVLSEKALDGALALVSGRSIDNLDKQFAPLRLCVERCPWSTVPLCPAGLRAIL